MKIKIHNLSIISKYKYFGEDSFSVSYATIYTLNRSQTSLCAF